MYGIPRPAVFPILSESIPGKARPVCHQQFPRNECATHEGQQDAKTPGSLGCAQACRRSWVRGGEGIE